MTSRALMLLAALLVGACQSPPPGERPDRVPNAGGARDEHGCLLAAGYRWCAARQGCVRPWELVPAGSTEKPAEAFDRACGAGP